MSCDIQNRPLEVSKRADYDYLFNDSAVHERISDNSLNISTPFGFVLQTERAAITPRGIKLMFEHQPDPGRRFPLQKCLS